MSATFVGAVCHVTAASVVDVLVKRIVVSAGAKQLGGVTPGGYTPEVACLHVVGGVPAAWATCPPLVSMFGLVWGGARVRTALTLLQGVGCWGATCTLPWVGGSLHILSGAKASLKFNLFTAAMALVWGNAGIQLCSHIVHRTKTLGSGHRNVERPHAGQEALCTGTHVQQCPAVQMSRARDCGDHEAAEKVFSACQAEHEAAFGRPDPMISKCLVILRFKQQRWEEAVALAWGAIVVLEDTARPEKDDPKELMATIGDWKFQAEWLLHRHEDALGTARAVLAHLTCQSAWNGMSTSA